MPPKTPLDPELIGPDFTSASTVPPPPDDVEPEPPTKRDRPTLPDSPLSLRSEQGAPEEDGGGQHTEGVERS
jgi:hypothetical protein